MFAGKNALVRGIALSLCFLLLDPLLHNCIFSVIQHKSAYIPSVLCGGPFTALDLTKECVYCKFWCTEADYVSPVSHSPSLMTTQTYSRKSLSAPEWYS